MNVFALKSELAQQRFAQRRLAQRPSAQRQAGAMTRRHSLLFIALCLLFLLSGCSKSGTPDTKGMIVGGTTYENPALGMIVKIYDNWYFSEERTGRHSSGQTSNQDTNASGVCTGPLCGDADADVALVIKNGTTPVASLSFLAYKLSWMDRMRYPLGQLAGSMTLGSLSRSGMVPVGHLTQGVRKGKTAYRLLLRQKDATDASEVCYVLESNGYTILLVGAVSNAPDLPKMQDAIENIKFDSER